jgi:penicillin amidase
VPPLGYGTALDTRVFGGGNIHQLGGWLGNLPITIGGTNGDVAWGGVNPVLDITDYYREEVQLDESGRPQATWFDGEWRPLTAVNEDFVVADVAVLDSVGRTETWTRWVTFDGRWLSTMEGRPATSTADAGTGESVINLLGDLVIPADTDADGVITGITFDHTAFDATRWIDANFEVGQARNVEGIRQAIRGLVGGGLFTGAADKDGSILYSSYQAVPCRGYLPREDGRFVDGADPSMLLDGTTYGGFTIPTSADGKADEAPGQTDPYQCVIGYDTMPYAKDPPSGFMFSANNDPAGLTDDGDERNDLHYLGGPWASTRANTIRRALAEMTADKKATFDDVTDLQANIESRLGEVFTPFIAEAIDNALAASMLDNQQPHERRLADLYTARSAELTEVKARLLAWGERGFLAESGVETFYASPNADQKKDAVATMIFNAAFRRIMSLVWDDENVSAQRWGGEQRTAALARYLAGRGPGNPEGLTSYNPATLESVFFDRLGTEVVERSDELILTAITEALDFLQSAGGAGFGGFGTADMDTWLWGLRHQVRFESILAGFIGDDPTLSLITGQFAITTDIHPLASPLPAGDPRRGLRWFPRGGDQWGVDAANPGLGGTNYTYGSGPAMRLVIALQDGKVEGRFILPGGQSGLTDSPYFADQTRLWLGNDYFPVRFAPADVAAGAIGREVYVPR